MKRILLALVLSATVGAHAQAQAQAQAHHDRLALASASKVPDVEEPQPTRPVTVDVRAIQVNRCTDAAGRLKLQDTPCGPLAATPASAAASTAADIVDLSALQPRSLKESFVRPREPDARSLTDSALSLGWKLALVVAFGYALFRGIRAWRDSYALASALSERQRTR